MNGVRTRVRHAAESLLRANWRQGISRDGREYAYTCPDGAKYPYQWFWDSLMHVLAWNEVDPGRAAAELRSLAAAQQPDGLIGHTLFWDGPVRLARLPYYNVRKRLDMATATIQPPFLGWAWAEVADRLAAHGVQVWTSDVVHARLDLSARGLSGLVRASVHVTNTEDELDRTVDLVDRISRGTA